MVEFKTSIRAVRPAEPPRGRGTDQLVDRDVENPSPKNRCLFCRKLQTQKEMKGLVHSLCWLFFPRGVANNTEWSGNDGMRLGKPVISGLRVSVFGDVCEEVTCFSYHVN